VDPDDEQKFLSLLKSMTEQQNHRISNLKLNMNGSDAQVDLKLDEISRFYLKNGEKTLMFLKNLSPTN
jgi:hypothetical protein